MKPSDYLFRADRAIHSARLLLSDQDTDGACNRAYYSMFDAAHAALIYVNLDNQKKAIKTHHGLISVFSSELVKSGILSSELGKSLNQVEHVRLLADYIGEPVSSEKAQWAIEQAEMFLKAIKALLS